MSDAEFSGPVANAVIWSLSGTLHASRQSTKHLHTRRSATTRRLAEKCMLLMRPDMAQSIVLNIFPFFDTPVTTLWGVHYAEPRQHAVCGAPADGEENPVLAVGCDVHVDAGDRGGAGGSAEDDDSVRLLNGETGQAAIVGAVSCLLGLAFGGFEEGECRSIGAADVVGRDAVTR